MKRASTRVRRARHDWDARDVQVVDLLVDGRRALRRALAWLVAIETGIVLLDVCGNWLHFIGHDSLRKIVNIAREGSLGNWLSSTLFLLLGLVAAMLAVRERQCGARRTSRVWAVFAVVFCYLSADDSAMIHERVGTAVQDLGSAASAQASFLKPIMRAFPSYGWQLVFMPVFVPLGLWLLVFLWREARQPATRRHMIYGFACLALAEGIDFIEGMRDGYRTLAMFFALHLDAVAHFSKVIEESLEMFGMTLLLAALLEILLARPLRLEVATAPTP